MKSEKKKISKGWGIKLKNGTILTFSIRHTRNDAIRDVESYYISQWKKLRKQGMAVVKLEIKEIEQADKAIQIKDPKQPFPQLEMFK